MVLRLPLDGLAESAERLGVPKIAWIRERAGMVSITLAKPEEGTILAANVEDTPENVRAALREDGITVLPGEWTEQGEGAENEQFLTAIAYRSREEKPGLWVDASFDRPSIGEALDRLYDDLNDNGDLDDLSFEEFMRHGMPNVVILGPAELRDYAEKNRKDR